MNNWNILIIICALFLFACKEPAKPTSDIHKNREVENSSAVSIDRTVFLIDHCENARFSAVLEKDKTKGNDSCILRINSKDGTMNKIEILNVPTDKTSINSCEKDYVVVGFACGGPCYSKIFVFTDHRKNKQFAYCQTISNNPNIVAHIQNEEFETLRIYNLITSKEISVAIPDNDAMWNYGQMDTLYIKHNKLFIEYPTINKKTIKKSIPLEKIME